MASPRRSIWRSVALVAAAYLIVAQAVLAGLTTGAHAGPAPLDAFGQVICSTVKTGAPEAPSPHLAKCCASGCTMAGPHGAPPPIETATAGPEASGRLSLNEARGAGLRRSPEHCRPSARAPPRTM